MKQLVQNGPLFSTVRLYHFTKSYHGLETLNLAILSTLSSSSFLSLSQKLVVFTLKNLLDFKITTGQRCDLSTKSLEVLN
jgi:hypothetical protein